MDPERDACLGVTSAFFLRTERKAFEEAFMYIYGARIKLKRKNRASVSGSLSRTEITDPEGISKRNGRFAARAIRQSGCGNKEGGTI